jgi:hypothetical protein
MPEFRQLAQRIAVNYHISPLDKVQTKHYIDYRMQKAGGKGDIFSQEAIDMIFEQSGGIPRTINLICDTALVYGFADNLSKINQPVIKHVIKDNICMAVNEKNESVKQNKDAVLKNDAGPDVLKRIRRMEMSIKKMKTLYENLIQKVNNDLIGKYRQLLIAEQRRNDQLLEKYYQLIRRMQISEESPCDGDDLEDHQGGGSVTKFSHLMDMADAQDAIDKERTKISELLVKKVGGKNQRSDF